MTDTMMLEVQTAINTQEEQIWVELQRPDERSNFQIKAKEM